jgi:molecular chaperone HtpG
MTQKDSSFKVGIDFEAVLAAISKQIYETPLAFLRENVQNAVDAIRIQALRDNIPSSDERYRVNIEISDLNCTIRDNGIGMTQDDLRFFFWTIGGSGKRTPEAKRAGCLGMFGIGGFANLGVCDKLEVISHTEEATIGTYTVLSEEDIKAAPGAIPSVRSEESNQAAPRGTIVIGHLRQPPNISELKSYLHGFVRFAQERIYFNGDLISQEQFPSTRTVQTLRKLTAGPMEWEQDTICIRGELYENEAHTLLAVLSNLWVKGQEVQFSGFLRFESGSIDVFKRRFKLCATKLGTQIGVSGSIDCDLMSPTAGRDSLDAESSALLSSIVNCMERVAVEAVLKSSELLAEHTRIFPYILRMVWTNRLDNLLVRLADGSTASLDSLRVKSERGIGIFYGREQREALTQIMQARGNLVVLLPADSSKQKAVKQFLVANCKAKQFEGVVECREFYSDLTRFEHLFLSELETSIVGAYDVSDVRLIPGKLTEDIPVFLSEESAVGHVEIYVDVRHPEITKLQILGFTPLFYSMVAAFCREYLGPALRKRSPKFFGDGAVNLDWLAKRRSELWILLKEDIEVVSRAARKDVVRYSDVQVVHVGAQPTPTEPVSRKPKLLHVVGDQTFADIIGYYIRLPEGAVRAYGDVIKECDSRGVVWAGNKMLFVASDTISSAFQFEIRLDHLIFVKDDEGRQSIEGACELRQPLQELHEGLYFPIPTILESVLVPQGDAEIRIEVHCDWIDMKTAKVWEPSALAST